MPVLPYYNAMNPSSSTEPPDADNEPSSGTPSQFVAIAPLYDALMNGVPYDDWVSYLHQLLELRQARPRHILDLACGTGNVSELLATQGYAMTGVDIAPHMIAEAQRKAAVLNLPIAYTVQDAATLDLPGKRFDLCISLFDSLNYITDPERLSLAFERVGAHLTRNGLFIFDLNTEFALKNKFFDQNNLGSDDRLRYNWVSDYFPQTHLCRIRMRFWFREDDGTDRVFDEVHWQYAYRQDEIVAMLQAAGFTNIVSYKAYTLRPPARTADRIYYIAQWGNNAVDEDLST